MTAPVSLLRDPEPRVTQACVTGWAIHVPDHDDALPAERARELLGRKGLLYKEPATRLALLAVHRALGLPAGTPRAAGTPDPRTAVIAASNLGNVETVTRVARTVRETSGHDVSPLDAPNASSNVIASTVAIWFRFGGPNLMVCSGATAGLDALRLALLLLRARRADRVVVVGVEPDDAVSVALRARRRAGVRAPACAGAAALVLEPEGDGPRLGPVSSAGKLDELEPGAQTVIGPHGGALDLEARLGDLYGALGVVQLATAAALAADGAGAVAVICGDAQDGWRTVTVTPAEGSA